MRKLLVVSHVLPFPGNSGQQLRVRNTLNALRRSFHVTFLTACRTEDVEEVTSNLEVYTDEVVCLRSRYNRNSVSKVFHSGIGTLYAAYSSLKKSNYVISELEFTPRRIEAFLNGKHFDLVMFEYWHAHKVAAVLKDRKIPCVVDTHNVLSNSFRQQLSHRRRVPVWLAEFKIRRYSTTEEKAWNAFDGVIAINREEERLIRSRVRERQVFYVPMGIDMSVWPFTKRLHPPAPIRIGYYGGLGSQHNQQSALDVYKNIMPLIWHKFPDAEYWIIGSNPPKEIRALQMHDRRVRVTGFVDKVQEVLCGLNVVVCPWRGRYGFRSRLVEIMAIGVPLVTTHDAVDGMEFEHQVQVMLGCTDSELAGFAMHLLENRPDAELLRRNARRTVEELYSTNATYGRLNGELNTWLDAWPADAGTRNPVRCDDINLT